MNQSAFNLGNAGGALVGSELLSHGFGYPSLGIASAMIAGVGIALVRLSMRLDAPGAARRTPHALPDTA